MDLAGRKERGKAYCPIVVGSGIVPLPEKKTVKNHKNGCIRMYETVTEFYQIAHNWLRFKAGSNSSPVSRTRNPLIFEGTEKVSSETWTDFFHVEIGNKE